LNVIREQRDPVGWLVHHFKVSQFELVTEDVPPKEDLPASTTATLGLAAPQSQGVLILALLVSDWRRNLEPNPALTLALTLSAGSRPERAELLKHPTELAALVNAIAQTYCESLAQDQGDPSLVPPGPISFHKADPTRSYWLQ
jgi:hypothetical protein